MSSYNRARLEAFPWVNTSLGPPEGWPPEMRSLIQTIMAAEVAICTAWGTERIQIYNDGFSQVFGLRHPASFGAPLGDCWPDNWPALHAALDQVHRTGAPLVLRDIAPPAVNGASEGRSFDLSLSAIRALNGKVIGVMSIATQTTGTAMPQHPRGSAPGGDEDPHRLRALSHEFNNVLTVILGNLDVLAERLTEDSDLKLLANALQAAEEATTLTRALRTPAPVPQQPSPPESAGTSAEQLASRERLAASEWRYRTLFDFLPIAIWEEDISDVLALLEALKRSGVTDLGAWLDENPAFIDRALASIRVLGANRAARILHGITKHDPDAPDARDILSQSLARHAREARFRESLRRMLFAAWNGTKSITVDSTLLRPDGSKIDIQVQMLLPESGSGRLLVSELDVTEQHRAEERFRHVAQASSDYIFDRDFVSETTWVNDGASWHPDLPAGPSVVPRGAWVDSVHPEDSDRILKGVETAIENGETFWEGEYRLRMRDGDFIPVRERASILRNDDGVPVRMIGNIVDLSEQKALEAQLRQSQRLDAIGQLTGGIAHDFNNLLTVILGNAEMLIDDLPADLPAAARAGQIISASERAAELTQRLLAFARKQPLAPGVHDAGVIIDGMRILIERSITPAIALEVDLAAETGCVHVDRAMFESALLNLCLNARDAMPEGGRLRIKAGLAGDQVRIVVSDTGTGMDDDTLLRVFEPFFTTKPPGEGNGLGMSMVYGFVNQSGGEIRIDSEPGAGTTVTLLLPAHASPPLADAPPPPEADTVQITFRGRILVVEDHAQVRDYTCALVRSMGFEVVAEPDAVRALARLRAGERFDILLSDVVMPGGMSGRNLAETVHTEWPDLPVLLVSGHTDELLALDPQLAPHIAFLRKPFRKHDLADRLARMLPGT
ncbi:MAG: PAS domain-containing protein [Pararhodobacter sp.]|nr:PAS domain-containing protein [Pararhodobacter sp.]